MSDHEHEQTDTEEQVDDLEVSDQDAEEISGGGLSHGMPEGVKDNSV